MGRTNLTRRRTRSDLERLGTLMRKENVVVCALCAALALAAALPVTSGRSLQQLVMPEMMPGPMLAGGWSDVSVDDRFQDLVNVFNYASLVLPQLNSNGMSSPNPSLQLCYARSQVGAGMNYFLSLSPDCTDAAQEPKNIIYQSLDGQFEITSFSGV